MEGKVEIRRTQNIENRTTVQWYKNSHLMTEPFVTDMVKTAKETFYHFFICPKHLESTDVERLIVEITEKAFINDTSRAVVHLCDVLCTSHRGDKDVIDAEGLFKKLKLC